MINTDRITSEYRPQDRSQLELWGGSSIPPLLVSVFLSCRPLAFLPLPLSFLLEVGF